MLTPRPWLSFLAGAVRRLIGCEAAHEVVVACPCVACAPTWPAEGGASLPFVSSFLLFFCLPFQGLSKESWFNVPALEVLPDLFRLACCFRSIVHTRAIEPMRLALCRALRPA